ncbi:MAG: hypothetical protein IPK06_00080 [Ignavibacteriae bacterium]|nr:hypothetical protein [Ignavibacteriota bacterium]
MKNRSKIILLIALTFSIFTSNLFAQQWSSEQKEVWAGIEKYWEVSSKGDVQGFMSYFDESYIGWSYQTVVPQNKSNTSKWITNEFKNNTTLLYTLTPVTIWVKGDFAFANYFYSQIEKNNQIGKEEQTAGKWTDILMKKDGKWFLIGDHGGRTSKTQ